MPAPILLGRSDFVSLREAGALYVDKSDFVREVLDAPAEVMLYPRPRRFGKTLNMSMLQAFLERGPERSALFEDLSIWRHEAARAHFQRYPTISLTFKDVKQRSWAEAKGAILATLAAEVRRHRVAVEDPRLDPALRDGLLGVAERGEELPRLLLDLSQAL